MYVVVVMLTLMLMVMVMAMVIVMVTMRVQVDAVYTNAKICGALASNYPSPTVCLRFDFYHTRTTTRTLGKALTVSTSISVLEVLQEKSS